MPATRHEAPSPRTNGVTLIDLSAFLADPRSFPHASPATRERFHLACRTLFDPDLIDPATRIDDLDIGALSKAAATANPTLVPATLRAYERTVTVAICALRESLNSRVDLPGTVADLPAFLTQARERGERHPRTIANDIYAVKRLLRDLPDLADQNLTALDLEKVARRFTELNPTVKETTVKAYIARLQHAIAVYSAPLSTVESEPEAPTRPTPPAHDPAVLTTSARTPEPGHLAIPLPGGRAVNLATPPDLTGQEAAATGALLRLYHPAMFTPSPVTSRDPAGESGRWTLLFWPEHAPDAPEAAHLSGPTFRRALADHVRARCEELTEYPDDDAIDAWFSTEVFVALALPGHHDARDAATLL
ncbi:hypothetical protein [Actinospica robiniae]|uniref:hypothetical protein n=1 Tax=Actinospica robiniae TaxID=304901 RepID=UPI0004004AF0|nr:hypothetical protein [Actinospica robiniae]